MSEEHADTQEQAAPQEPREDYETPKLTDLGSFEDLTQFNPTGVTDSEGSS